MSLAFGLYEREQHLARYELVVIHITIGCYRSPLMFLYILVTNVIYVYTNASLQMRLILQMEG